MVSHVAPLFATTLPGVGMERLRLSILNSTESPPYLSRTQGTSGLSRGIPEYATPSGALFTENESSPFAVSMSTPIVSPVRVLLPLLLL